MRDGKNFVYDQSAANVRRHVPSNVKARRFGQGQEVLYKGTAYPALKDKKGVIDAYVNGSDHTVAVTFEEMPPEDRYYLLHDENSLDVWRGKPKSDRIEKDDKKEVKVEKRKGVAKGKRKNQDED